MDETALRRLLDGALLIRTFPECPVPAPVPQAGIMLGALATLQAVLGSRREQTQPRGVPLWMKPPCGSCWTAP
jgi:hypothetical protein